MTSSGDLGFNPEDLPSDAGQADFSGITPEQVRSVFDHLSDEEMTGLLRRIDGERVRARDARDLLQNIVGIIVDVAGGPLRGILG